MSWSGATTGVTGVITTSTRLEDGRPTRPGSGSGARRRRPSRGGAGPGRGSSRRRATGRRGRSRRPPPADVDDRVGVARRRGAPARSPSVGAVRRRRARSAGRTSSMRVAPAAPSAATAASSTASTARVGGDGGVVEPDADAHVGQRVEADRRPPGAGRRGRRGGPPRGEHGECRARGRRWSGPSVPSPRGRSRRGRRARGGMWPRWGTTPKDGLCPNTPQ